MAYKLVRGFIARLGVGAWYAPKECLYSRCFASKVQEGLMTGECGTGREAGPAPAALGGDLH